MEGSTVFGELHMIQANLGEGDATRFIGQPTMGFNDCDFAGKALRNGGDKDSLLLELKWKHRHLSFIIA
jgi:hypothetical protein